MDLRRGAASTWNDLAEGGDEMGAPDCEVPRPPDGVPAGLDLREIWPGVYVVAVPARFPPEIAEHFERALLTVVDTEPRFLILDASGIADVEPSGVGVLVTVAERAGHYDVGLCLVVESDTFRERLAASGVLDLFETAPTVDQAARMLG